MIELNKIYCMDNVQGMRQIADESVDLAVTGYKWKFINK